MRDWAKEREKLMKCPHCGKEIEIVLNIPEKWGDPLWFPVDDEGNPPPPDICGDMRPLYKYGTWWIDSLGLREYEQAHPELVEEAGDEGTDG